MTCTVSDTILDLNGSPLIGASVYAVPDTLPLFLSGIERQISHLHTLTGAAGRFSLPLPWPSVCDPATVKWQIVLPDSVIWKGASPEGVTGPLTLKQLKDSYAWGLVSGGSTSTIVAVQGPAGTSGTAYPGVAPDGLTPGGLNVAGVVDALKVNGVISYAIVDNFAGQTVPAGSPALLPFDNINVMSTDFTLSSDLTQIHFGPGTYIVTADAYAASAALTSGFLSVQMVFGSSGFGARSINQAGTVPAALSGFGPVGFGFVATTSVDNWVSLQAYQTDTVDRSIAGDLLIVRLGKA